MMKTNLSSFLVEGATQQSIPDIGKDKKFYKIASHFKNKEDT